MTQGAVSIISIAKRTAEPIEWPRITYLGLLGSLGLILEQIRVTLVKEQDVPELPIVAINVDYATFKGMKSLLWDYECVGGSTNNSRFVRFSGYESGNPKKVFAWGHFIIGHSRAPVDL